MNQTYNIQDIDLTNKDMMKICLRNWSTIEELSEVHIKALDLLIEMRDKWNDAPLTETQRSVMETYILDGEIQSKKKTEEDEERRAFKKECVRSFSMSEEEFDAIISDALDIICKEKT